MLDGPVLPGSKYNYVFSTSIANSESLRYLCVSVQLEDDVSPGGNRMCTQFRNELFVLDCYPNPTRSILNMEWISGIAKSVRISLTDALGRTVMAHETHCLPGLNERTLDLEALQSGIYYLLVSDGITVNRQRILISSDP
jgi:hypothetical protein